METRDSRKIEESSRKHVSTKIQATGCKFGLCISYRKKKGALAIGWSNQEHNHPINPDPFQYNAHKPRVPDAEKTKGIAGGLHGNVPFSTAKTILRKLGLRMERKTFYNLERRQKNGKLTKQEELALIIEHLEEEHFRIRVNDEYIVNEKGARTSRTVKDLFYCSSEQIRLARRFVSECLLETDATFSTNKLWLPLSVLIGIQNIGRTISVAVCFITSESAVAFHFMDRALSELVFYGCLKQTVTLAITERAWRLRTPSWRLLGLRELLGEKALVIPLFSSFATGILSKLSRNT